MQKNNLFLDYLGVIILVLTSDAICFLYTLKPLFAFLAFFIYSICRYIKTKPSPVYNVSIRYFIILGFSILLNVFVVNTNTTGNNGIAIFTCLIASYLFFTSYTFQRFREVYLDVIFAITIIGIPIFLMAELGLLPLTRITTFEGASRLQFSIFSVGWTDLHHRFAGIWHEAGACMIFLNIALLLYSTPIRNSEIINKATKWKLIIIVIGVLTTQSTTGYLAFMAIIVYSFLPKIKNTSVKTKIFYIILIIGACYYIFNSDVIVNKFAQDSSEGAQTSYAIRRMDNLSMLTMAIENPIFGYGYQTVEFDNRASYLGNITSSNGILYMAACAGIWWIVLYVLFLYKNIKRLGFSTPLFVVAIFILLQCNERFVELPISYVFLTAFCLNSKSDNY